MKNLQQKQNSIGVEFGIGFVVGVGVLGALGFVAKKIGVFN